MNIAFIAGESHAAQWVYGHGLIEFLAKSLAVLAVCIVLGSIDAVRQFHDCHSGKG